MRIWASVSVDAFVRIVKMMVWLLVGVSGSMCIDTFRGVLVGVGSSLGGVSPF